MAFDRKNALRWDRARVVNPHCIQFELGGSVALRNMTSRDIARYRSFPDMRRHFRHPAPPARLYGDSHAGYLRRSRTIFAGVYIS